MDIHQVIIEPRITEKATFQKEGANQISLRVHPQANKIEIKSAVERLFKTKVVSVQTMNLGGKKRRMGRNMGRRANWKKAIVRLAPGENIEFFEGV